MSHQPLYESLALAAGSSCSPRSAGHMAQSLAQVLRSVAGAVERLDDRNQRIPWADRLPAYHVATICAEKPIHKISFAGN